MNAQSPRTRLQKLNHFALRPHQLIHNVLEPSSLQASLGNTLLLELSLQTNVSRSWHKGNGDVNVVYPLAPCEIAAEHDHLSNPVGESLIPIHRVDAFQQQLQFDLRAGARERSCRRRVRKRVAFHGLSPEFPDSLDQAERHEAF